MDRGMPIAQLATPSSTSTVSVKKNELIQDLILDFDIPLQRME